VLQPKLELLTSRLPLSNINSASIIPDNGYMSVANKQKWITLARNMLKNPVALATEFERLLQTKQPVPPQVMSLAITSFGRLAQGLRILDLMTEEVSRGAFTPQLRHVTNLITALGQSNEYEAVLVLYQLLLESHYDNITFVAVVDVLARSYHLDLIQKLWYDWRNMENCPPPTINFFTTLCEAYLRGRRFDLFQEAEEERRRLYQEAVSQNKWSRIAVLQTTPKHCTHVSRLLRLRWFKRLPSTIPQHLRDNLAQNLDSWSQIRKVLPGSPLTKAEREKWEIDLDFWISVNSQYGSERIADGQGITSDTSDDQDLWDDSWLCEDLEDQL
jgi:hypothetical protein